MSVVLTCFFVFVIALAVITTPGAVSVNAANTGDPIRGKDLFEKRCGGCHSLDAAKEGPPLRNVYGRKAGSISSFKYSDALKGAQFTWDQNSLDKWLVNTESVIPDNDMDFHVPKADERADIIEYLRASSGK
jgi:cytochrome c